MRLDIRNLKPSTFDLQPSLWPWDGLPVGISVLIRAEGAAVRFLAAGLLVLNLDEGIVGAVGAEDELVALADPDFHQVFVLPRLIAGQPVERLPAHGDDVASAAGRDAFKRLVGLGGPGQHDVRVSHDQRFAQVAARGDQLLTHPASVHPVVILEVDEPPVFVELHMADDLDQVAFVECGAQQVSAAGPEAAGGHFYIDRAPNEIGRRRQCGAGGWGDAGSGGIGWGVGRGGCVSLCRSGGFSGRVGGSGQRRRGGFWSSACGKQDGDENNCGSNFHGRDYTHIHPSLRGGRPR